MMADESACAGYQNPNRVTQCILSCNRKVDVPNLFSDASLVLHSRAACPITLPVPEPNHSSELWLLEYDEIRPLLGSRKQTQLLRPRHRSSQSWP